MDLCDVFVKPPAWQSDRASNKESVCKSKPGLACHSSLGVLTNKPEMWQRAFPSPQKINSDWIQLHRHSLHMCSARTQTCFSLGKEREDEPCDLAVMFILLSETGKEAILRFKSNQPCAEREVSPNRRDVTSQLGADVSHTLTHTEAVAQFLYKALISFLLLISHNAFLRCANKVPEIHIHKPGAQMNAELSTLSQWKGIISWLFPPH